MMKVFIIQSHEMYFNKTQRTHMQSYDHTFAGSN